MPLYSFICTSKKCGLQYEQVLKLEEYERKTKCPTCWKFGKRIIKTNVKEPTFNEKLYPYFDPNLGKVCETPNDRKRIMKEMGLISIEGRKKTTARQEKYLMEHRMFLKGAKGYKYLD